MWVIDIEGGELGLLEEAVNQQEEVSWPNKIIIELHPNNGGTVNKVLSLLKKIDQVRDAKIIEVSEESSAVSGDIVASELN